MMKNLGAKASDVLRQVLTLTPGPAADQSPQDEALQGLQRDDDSVTVKDCDSATNVQIADGGPSAYLSAYIWPADTFEAKKEATEHEDEQVALL